MAVLLLGVSWSEGDPLKEFDQVSDCDWDLLRAFDQASDCDSFSFFF